MNSKNEQVKQFIRSGIGLVNEYLTETFSSLYKVAKEKGITEFGWKGETEPFEEDYDDCEQFNLDNEECEKWKLFFVLGQDYTQRCRVVTGITYELCDGYVKILRTYKFFECEIVDENDPDYPDPMWYGNFQELVNLAGLIAEELGVKI